MNTFQNILTLTGIATVAVAAYQLVGFDDAPISADDAPVKGVAQNPAAIGDAFGVNALGTAQVKAVGTIAKGDRLMSADNAGVKKVSADPANAFATALTSAADGELVEILIR